MFNSDFYPTPENTIHTMLHGMDVNGKTVLEPSAGKGNIVDVLKSYGAKVLACEIHMDLAKIISSKAQFLKNDFLQVVPNEVSHIGAIVMNPPFSNDCAHILHAWKIAPAGCEIVSLVNHSSIKNQYRTAAQELFPIIESYGSLENLGNPFSDAERSTDVHVGLIRLFKPADENNEFDGFFLEEEPEGPAREGIMKYNYVRDIVQRYIGSVKCFDEHLELNKKMNKYTAPFGVGGFTFQVGYNDTVCTHDEFKKALQKKAWEHLFNEMNMSKYLTAGVIGEINKFVETQTQIPFTMRNIYKMFDIIRGTKDQIFNKALEEAVDNFTRHTHENRYNVEGWKTNSGYMLNKKFILDYMTEKGYKVGRMYAKSAHSSYSNAQRLNDLVKVIAANEGIDYDTIPDLYNLTRYSFHVKKDGQFIRSWGEYKYLHEDKYDSLVHVKQEAAKVGVELEIVEQKSEFGKWMDWGFFEIKGYMKGSLHLKFKDENVWARLMQRYAKIKGQTLPEKL